MCVWPGEHGPGERQQENEKAWHNRNKGLYDLKYHQIQKAERFKKLKAKPRLITAFI